VHPDPRFTMTDEDAMRAIVLREGMVHLFAATPGGPMVAHVPVTMTELGNFRFHIARANRITSHLDGAQVTASVMGAHGYISPDWYAKARNQVPTWNYVAVEIDRVLTELNRNALIEQIEELAAFHEDALSPKPQWNLTAVDPMLRDKMLSALCVFELQVDAIRGTAKLNQNKSSADRAGVRSALDSIGNGALAAIIAP
jgi:transcriptional regulator